MSDRVDDPGPLMGLFRPCNYRWGCAILQFSSGTSKLRRRIYGVSCMCARRPGMCSLCYLYRRVDGLLVWYTGVVVWGYRSMLIRPQFLRTDYSTLHIVNEI